MNYARSHVIVYVEISTFEWFQFSSVLVHINLYSLYFHEARGSAVERGAGCRMHPIPVFGSDFPPSEHGLYLQGSITMQIASMISYRSEIRGTLQTYVG